MITPLFYLWGEPMSQTTKPQKLTHTEPMTLAEVAKALNISGERVRQIEKIALRKCQAWLKERGLNFDALI